MVLDRSEVALAEGSIVASAQAGELFIQFIVKVSPLTVTQGNTECREDVCGSILVSQPDDAGDVLFIIFDERKDRHHGQAGQDADFRQPSHGGQPP